MIDVACEFCRRKRLRCDRGKPTCGRCLDKGLECERIVYRRVFGLSGTVSPFELRKTSPSVGNDECYGLGMMEISHGKEYNNQDLGENLMPVELEFNLRRDDLDKWVFWMDEPGTYLEALMEEEAICEGFMKEYIHQEMLEGMGSEKTK